TPSGNALVFLSEENGITSDANGGEPQYYRYSEEDDSLECLSCSPPGVKSVMPQEPERPRTAFAFGPTSADSYRLSGDGSMYAFNTDAALLPEDANGGPDIYEWRTGKLRLITDGEGEYGGRVSVPLELNGISPDGRDILFRVSARLTGFEHDEVGQLFDARLGGGFAPPNPPAACAEDACQGPLESAPAVLQPGSAALVGPGDAVQRQNRPKARCGKSVRKGQVKKPKARCVKKKAAQKQKASHQKRSGK
ncbi:MAG TPA: hypothetical protein VEW07_09750, partial [Solirubrobacterales bacterium]|nr:hypothetical protein [Solirubrobacterales bacterium]